MQAENVKKSKISFLNILYRIWAFIVYVFTFTIVDILAEKTVSKNKTIEKDPVKEQARQKQLDEQLETIKERALKTKFIKDEGKFKQQKQEEKNKAEVIAINHGKNEGKELFHKVPQQTEKDQKNLTANPNYSKFKNSWMSKVQDLGGTFYELLASEPIKMLLGEDFSPKYRLEKQNDGKFMVMTKMLKNFAPWFVVVTKALGEGASVGPEYTKLYIKNTSELENFERMIAVCLLFGKRDIHPGNWGIVEKDGKKYAAALDHAQAYSKLDIGNMMYEFMYNYMHCKEVIVTEKFVEACLDSVVTRFSPKERYI